jgi:hypothetical protein
MPAKVYPGAEMHMPKSGNHPMLLLEWMASVSNAEIESVDENTDDYEHPVFIIKFSDATVAEHCSSYINANI